jgi:flagellar protein FliJ
MRRFVFRFQRVLDVKERLEDARKAALGEVVGACETERRELERLQADHQAQIATQRPAEGRVDPGLMNMLADYGRRLERESGEQGEQVRLAEALVEERRIDLMEATRERRTFEILQERAEAEHRKAARRQELQFLDEVGGQLHLRQQRADADELQDDEHGHRRAQPEADGA